MRRQLVVAESGAGYTLPWSPAGLNNVPGREERHALGAKGYAVLVTWRAGLQPPVAYGLALGLLSRPHTADPSILGAVAGGRVAQL